MTGASDGYGGYRPSDDLLLTPKGHGLPATSYPSNVAMLENPPQFDGFSQRTKPGGTSQPRLTPEAPYFEKT